MSSKKRDEAEAPLFSMISEGILQLVQKILKTSLLASFRQALSRDICGKFKVIRSTRERTDYNEHGNSHHKQLLLTERIIQTQKNIIYHNNQNFTIIRKRKKVRKKWTNENPTKELSITQLQNSKRIVEIGKQSHKQLHLQLNITRRKGGIGRRKKLVAYLPTT